MMASEFGISLDISKTRTGIAYWEGSDPYGVESKSFTGAESLVALLKAWNLWLHDVMTGKLAWVAFEQALPRGIAHREQFYGMTALLRLEAAWIAAQVYPVHLATAKKALAGIGNADKASMVIAAQKRWPQFSELNHDEADALGIGLVALAKRGSALPQDAPGTP